MNRDRVDLLDDSNVSFAQDLVRSSAFWVDHRQGITHPMPGMADRIESGPHGLQIKFGANKFLIGHSIRLSKKTILYELNRSERLSQPLNQKLLFQRLITCARASVSDYADSVFEYYKGGVEAEEMARGYYEEEPYADDIRSQRVSGLIPLAVSLREVVPPSRDYWKGYMKFGTHAIKVDTYINRLLDFTE